jgi:DNA-binding response OmpR family regulator
MDALRGQEHESFDRSIDVHVSKLRAKVEKDPRAPRYVKTVRGVGYALVGPAR